MSRGRHDYAAVFGEMWAARNDERVHTFANGHVYGRKERRESIRANIRAQRGFARSGE